MSKNKDKKKQQKEPPPRHYLRVEAVNLDYFVYDTMDLSTIRGGGLMLLHSTDEAETFLEKNAKDMMRVTAGASQAIFEFSAESDDEAEKVRSALDRHLRTHATLKHATFVVDITSNRSPKGTKGFDRIREELIAKNRYRQMRQLALTIAEYREQGSGDVVYTRPCEVDFVRPAVKEQMIGTDKRLISESVRVRRDEGHKQKRDLYLREIQGLRRALDSKNPKEDCPSFLRAGEGNEQWKTRLDGLIAFLARDHEPASDFSQIGGNSDDQLNNKMAVIYVDGNRFSDIQRATCSDPKLQSQWDTYLSVFRRRVLARLLEKVIGDDAWRTPSNVFRLETLLWGGDEFTWVVPAWKGWETLELFLHEAEIWPKWERQRLTFAVGLVFCNIKAPINRIRRLAQDLADFAKKKTERQANAFAYQTLESFDHLEGDYHAVRQLHMPQGCKVEQLVVTATAFDELTRQIQHMKSGFPRGQLYTILRQLRLPDFDEAKRVFDRARMETHAAGLSEQANKKWLDELGATIPKTPKPVMGTEQWVHFADLWDYVPDPKP